MKIAEKVVLVTGAGAGIGRALALRCAAERARGVVVVDLDGKSAEATATAIGATAMPVQVDVADAAAVKAAVAAATRRFGQIDVAISNAGIFVPGDNALEAIWQRVWQVNLMAHVHMAQAVLPQMLARGEGYIVSTASAAGLLTQLGSPSYAVTKHAAIGYAEFLAITYGDKGIRVSVICPQGVDTRMLQDDVGPLAKFLRVSAIAPEQVAEAMVAGIDAETFLILPHPVVLDYYRKKAEDYDRWLAGMRRLQQKMDAEPTD